MIALDTNILARFLLKDDAKQYRTSVSLLQKKQEYTAPPSVLLELVWVLEINDCTRGEIVKGLRALFGLPNFKPMEFEAMTHTLRWYEAGMDFGDAVHLALCTKTTGFATFDKDLGKQARKMAAFPPVTIV
ncbi:MAG: type II toxin-antitoxin system VapC family toxin [Acidiferrobacterales bacterium]